MLRNQIQKIVSEIYRIIIEAPLFESVHYDKIKHLATKEDMQWLARNRYVEEANDRYKLLIKGVAEVKD